MADEDDWSKLSESLRVPDLAPLRALLDSGFDPRGYDVDGATPLHHAVMECRVDAVDLLIERGADVHQPATGAAADYLEEFVLDLALQAQFFMDWDEYDPVVRLLIARGASSDSGHLDESPVYEQRARAWQASRPTRE